MFRRRKKNHTIDIEEVFLDLHNAPGYHRENLEGVLERPIGERIFFIIGGVFLTLAVVFLTRVGILQTTEGQLFRARATNNHLRLVAESSERGIIYDRFGAVLASNELQSNSSAMSGESTTTRLTNFSLIRRYPENGFLHVLGFLQNNSGVTKGASGLEATYDDMLQGAPAKRIEEINAAGVLIGSGLATPPTPGYGLVTSINRDLQLHLADYIEKTKEERGFSGGVGIVMDVTNGDILALVSVPDFDPNILIKKPTQAEFNQIINDPERPFFNRAISGLYPPGSIVKPAIAAGALAEHVIDPATTIVSTGRLVLPNPYDPTKPSIFLDWKAHGAVDMRRAIAVSSDVYFYEVGGGFENQPGLGVARIKKYLSLFGLDKPTGIDLPGEKSGSLPDETKKKGNRAWSVGDTYHLSIGQGDLLVTPIEMAVYTAALATRGTLLQPHIAKALVDENKQTVQTFSYPSKATNLLSSDIFDVIHDGMRGSAMFGTASGLSGLPIAIGAKTGTAEIGKTGRVHSWSIGFLPYDHPRIAYTILMESGDVHNLVGATFVASQMVQWMLDTHFLDTLDNGFK